MLVRTKVGARKGCFLSTALGTVFVVLISAATPALAQLATIAPPPPAPVVDANGVDLTTGLFNASEISISIGAQSSGLTRDGSSFSAPYTDNFTGGVAELEDPNTGDVFINVTLGSNSERFMGGGIYRR